MNAEQQTPIRPRLSPGVVVPDAPAGAVVVTGPSGRLFSVSAEAAALLRLIDGQRDLEGLAAAASVATGRALSAADVGRVIERTLAPAGLVQPGGAPAATPPARPTGAGRLVLFSPAAVARSASRLTALFRPAVAWPLGAIALLAHVALFARQPFPPPGAALLDAGAWLAAAAGLAFSLVVHEWGHAAALIAAGGAPGAIGLSLETGLVAPFCDVHDAWRLVSARRALVDAGGLWLQLLFAGAVAAAGVATGWTNAAFVVFAIDTSLILNFVPSFSTDGAWLASDLAGGEAPPRRLRRPRIAPGARAALGTAHEWSALALAAAAGTFIAARLLPAATGAAETLRGASMLQHGWAWAVVAGLALAAAALLGSALLLLVRRLRPPAGPDDDPDEAIASLALVLRNRFIEWSVPAMVRSGSSVLGAEAALLPVMLSYSFPNASSARLRRLGHATLASIEIGRQDHAALGRGGRTHAIRHTAPLRALRRERTGAVVCALHQGPFFYVANALTELGVDLGVFASDDMREKNAGVWERIAARNGVALDLLQADRPRSVFEALRLLERGRFVVVYMDGQLGAGGMEKGDHHRASVRFLGHEMGMRTGPAWLAARARVPIVVAAAWRTAWGRRIVEFSDPFPPPDDTSHEARERRTRELYAWLEPHVARRPQQWAGTINPFMHWSQSGEAPTATQDDLARELLRVRALLADGRGRARLVADDARVGSLDATQFAILLHGPTRRVLQAPMLSRELLRAAFRRVRFADLPRRFPADVGALPEAIARLTLAGLATIEE